jgi:N-acetyl-anhydromuramyl-L-alanine amidase AmpD
LWNFILNRPDPGSYHHVVDRTGEHRQLIPYGEEAYHVGARKGDIRGNGLSVGLAFVMSASEWKRMDARSKDLFLDGAAGAVADIRSWFDETYGIEIPSRRLTVEEFWNGEPGFIPHGDLQSDREDPGEFFPWDEFITRIEGGSPVSPDLDSMTLEELTILIQKTANRLGADIAVDGDYGPATARATATLLEGSESVVSGLARLGLAR